MQKETSARTQERTNGLRSLGRGRLGLSAFPGEPLVDDPTHRDRDHPPEALAMGAALGPPFCDRASLGRLVHVRLPVAAALDDQRAPLISALSEQTLVPVGAHALRAARELAFLGRALVLAAVANVQTHECDHAVERSILRRLLRVVEMAIGRATGSDFRGLGFDQQQTQVIHRAAVVLRLRLLEPLGNDALASEEPFARSSSALWRLWRETCFGELRDVRRERQAARLDSCSIGFPERLAHA